MLPRYVEPRVHNCWCPFQTTDGHAASHGSGWCEPVSGVLVRCRMQPLGWAAGAVLQPLSCLATVMWLPLGCWARLWESGVAAACRCPRLVCRPRLTRRRRADRALSAAQLGSAFGDAAGAAAPRLHTAVAALHALAPAALGCLMLLVVKREPEIAFDET